MSDGGHAGTTAGEFVDLRREPDGPVQVRTASCAMLGYLPRTARSGLMGRRDSSGARGSPLSSDRRKSEIGVAVLARLAKLQERFDAILR